MTTEESSFDYTVTGAGSAGCVVAASLSETGRLARGRLDAAAAVRDIPVMNGGARIVATTTTIPLGGMSGGRAR